MRIIKPLVAFFIIIATARSASAQTLINSTGSTIKGATITVEYSVGEIVTTTVTNPSTICNQGLLQPNYGNLGTGVRDIITIKDINFYSDNNYVTAITNHKLYMYRIVDVLGRVLETGNVPANYRWNIQRLSSGLYFLHVINKQNHSAIYKFPKQ